MGDFLLAFWPLAFEHLEIRPGGIARARVFSKNGKLIDSRSSDYILFCDFLHAL